jgi:hypothetical protein
MNANESTLPRARRPIALSLFFGVCSAGYILCLVALAVFAIPLFGIGRGFGASSRPLNLADAFFGVSCVISPLLYFVLSYLCCRPQTTGRRLRRIFLASVVFLILAVVGIGFGTAVDSFSSRTGVVIMAVLMSMPFAFASACIFYSRWGPPACATNVA